MEGVVISSSNAMCEVLYLNGWVIWHAQASFQEVSAANRNSRLLITSDLGDVAEYVSEGRSEVDAAAESEVNASSSLNPKLIYWLREMHCFDMYTSAQLNEEGIASSRSTKRQQTKKGDVELLKTLKEVYTIL